MEGDLQNVAEASPHTGFNSLVCAEMFSVESGSVCRLDSAKWNVLFGCPSESAGLLLGAESGEFHSFVGVPSFPSIWTCF